MPLVNGEFYVFINKQSGTALDLDTRDNKTVQGWARHGGPNQRWQAIMNGELTHWVFKNVKSNGYLSYEGSPDNGQRVVCQHDPFGWTEVHEGNNVYTIHVKNHSNTCIDLADHGNGANGTSVQLWSDNGNKNQKWEAQKVD